MIRITSAREGDAATLAGLGERTFIETFASENSAEDMRLHVAGNFSEEKQLREIRDPDRRIEIAWIGEEAVGYSHLRAGPADRAVTGVKPIELLRLYVLARWHGKGVGALLMDRCIETALPEGFKTIWLGVWEKNFKAQAFYRRYGFVEVGSHVFTLGRDPQRDLILCRTIP